MRIENTRITEHIGSVRIHDLRRLVEFDSGMGRMPTSRESMEVLKISREALAEVEQRMAIVLPIKDEDLKVFEGVLSGIPHDCLLIVVSNSSRGETDTFRSEHDIVDRFCRVTKRQALIIHQKNPVLAGALSQAGYSDILGDDGLIRNGKSEGMLLGIFLAMLYGKEYVGFIDTDNYIPGAVWEYVKHFAIGFNIAPSPYSMTRILWHYKPKIIGELYFKKWGRVSEISNRYLNQLISSKGKFETDIVKTANAGEHAMTIELAKRLYYATGYGIETEEIISILEQFGGFLPITDPDIIDKGIDIIQTETINPHLHKEKGEEHLLEDMLLPSLSVIYHSPLAEPDLKEEIKRQLIAQGCLQEESEVPQVKLLSPPQKVDLNTLARALEKELPLYAIPKGEPLWTKFPVGGLTSEIPIKEIIFTGLDGSLLHPLTHSYAPALSSIRALQEKRIPLIFCSHRTLEEQTILREDLGINDPFIVEDGGAIFIPKDYFRFPFAYDKLISGFFVIELGESRSLIRQRLKPIQEEFGLVTFSDLTTEEVAKETGFTLKMAAATQKRDYSEIVMLGGDKRKTLVVTSQLKKAGFTISPWGKHYLIGIGNDKSKATRILTELLKLNLGQLKTIGIGSKESDEPLLSAVDWPFLVQREDGKWSRIKVRHIQKVKGVGPEGWANVSNEILSGKIPK